LNNISGNTNQKFDKTSFKVIYKNTFTKELVQKWQNLSAREHLKHEKSHSKERGQPAKKSYNAPLDVDIK
jgi:hypothetical protein